MIIVSPVSQPIYEPQNVKRTVTTVTKTTRYDAPPIGQAPNYPSRDAPADTSRDAAARAPSLRSNLCELDTMLDDLNSAQFMEEVDKKSQGELLGRNPI